MVKYYGLLLISKGGVILRHKNLIRFLNVLSSITTIILVVLFFIGNIKSTNLLPFVFINLLLSQILNYKENKAPNHQYTKYDGMKKILSGLIFFWIIIIGIMIFHIIIAV